MTPRIALDTRRHSLDVEDSGRTQRAALARNDPRVLSYTEYIHCVTVIHVVIPLPFYMSFFCRRPINQVVSEFEEMGGMTSTHGSREQMLFSVVSCCFVVLWLLILLPGILSGTFFFLSLPRLVFSMGVIIHTLCSPNQRGECHLLLLIILFF